MNCRLMQCEQALHDLPIAGLAVYVAGRPGVDLQIERLLDAAALAVADNMLSHAIYVA